MTPTRSRGQGLVEFALVFPILILVLLGIIDGGRLVYAYNAVSNAAREAGRTAIINQTPAAIRSKAAQQATLLNLPTADPGACPTAGGVTTASNAIGTCVVFRSENLSAACATPKVGCNAIVAVKYEWRPITPLVGDLLGPIALTSTSTQVIESACVGNSCLDR